MASTRLSKFGDKVLTSRSSLRLGKNALILALIVFLVALVIRSWHVTLVNYLDHNGDSYHHWLTSYLTATHGYVHTDFKGSTINVAWLPLYHYIIAVLMNMFNVYDLRVQHGLNILLGSLTCVVVFVLARNSGSPEIGFGAGLALAVQPWFVDVTTLGVTEVPAVFLLVLGIYLFVQKKVSLSAIPIALAMFIRYEAWIFALAFLTVGLVQRRSIKQLIIYAIICASVVVSWSLNSWTQTGHFLQWYSNQAATIRWDHLFTTGIGTVPEYLETLFEVTSGMFLLGLAVGLLKKDRSTRLLVLLELTYLLAIILQSFKGSIPYQVRFLSYLFPLTAALSANVVGFLSALIKRCSIRNMLTFFILATIVVSPAYNQYWILAPTTDQTKLDRHVAAELVAGQLLNKTYVDGNVLCDSPTIIYHSHMDPAKFYSTSSLEWYSQRWNKSDLVTWIRDQDVRYLVWQNVSYSASWWMFPELSNGNEFQIFFDNNREITFRIVAWTISDFGPIYIYGITIDS